MTRSPDADVKSVTSPRALALLASVASPVFLAAAVAGWLTGFWPATPFTLGVASVAVIAGPLLGMVHVGTTDKGSEDEPEISTVTKVIPDPLITPRAASARAFHNWRGSLNPAIERRERERRASQYIRA
jgi:hypothetical protein